jgi:hypothetical protein
LGSSSTKITRFSTTDSRVTIARFIAFICNLISSTVLFLTSISYSIILPPFISFSILITSAMICPLTPCIVCVALYTVSDDATKITLSSLFFIHSSTSTPVT